MHYFDGVLQARLFVAGDSFSMADITVFASLNFGDAAGISAPEGCTSLIAWRERVAALPSVGNRSGQSFLPDDLRRFGF